MTLVQKTRGRVSKKIEEAIERHHKLKQDKYVKQESHQASSTKKQHKSLYWWNEQKRLRYVLIPKPKNSEQDLVSWLKDQLKALRYSIAVKLNEQKNKDGKKRGRMSLDTISTIFFLKSNKKFYHI